ncbi:MAG: NnrS family protein [Proteobacteria bacterium]|nr:NnrS family protein [Pseudomonadota bacterium]
MSPSPQIEARRGYSGPALLERGFRPFFFFAGVWAVVSLGGWLGFLSGVFQADSGIDILAWHSHELIFGYGASVVMGFALTAIPNWTGRLPVRGNRLAVLAVAWLVARVASLAALGNAGITPYAAAAEVAVLGGFAILVFREIAAGGNWRNLPVAGMVTLLGLAAATSHAGRLGLVDLAGHGGMTGTRAGLAVLILLITLIGGRIIPSFTGNWLKQQAKSGGEARLPAPFGRLDQVTILATALALGIWLALPASPETGVFMGLLAALHLARLARWRGLATFAEPLVTMLHVAYAWIPAGFALMALASFGLFSATAALHAWTIGAVGGMTLAVMMRASLGHSGRKLTATRLTVTLILLLHGAALLRVLDGVITVEGINLVTIAGSFWLAAFVLYVFEYAPIQLRK